MGLVTTDLGLVSSENANWLYKQNIITREGSIKNLFVDGFNGEVQLYSYFRWIVDDIKNNIPTIPPKLSLNINDLVQIMRLGKLEKDYQVEKQSYVYKANYPAVNRVYETGRKAYAMHSESKKNKGKGFDF